MSKIYQTTDELWEAVINNLPEEIKANVSAFAGKAYIHIKPKSKHLGVNDFKYCVEYSKTKSRAYVNVETLNGGTEGKSTIQNYIDSNNADCIVKSVVPQQGTKNKDKWKWEVTTPATELNEELAQWYVNTITAFWIFFEGAACSKSESSEIELKDIAKKSVIFLSFTQNEGDEFYCYLHNIIKDGALYYVGENLGKIDCSAVENYDASEYDCCSENIEDEYADVESLAEQLVNDFVEARYDECEQDNGAMAIDDEYTITICVGDNKVYEQTVCKSVESGNGWTDFDDDEEKSTNCKAPKTKQVRLAIFAAQQPRLISLQTLCEDDMEVVDENGASVETYEHLVDHGSGEWVNLAFVPSGCCVELNVTDPNADDDDDDAYRLYSDDEFEVCPNYGMMNMQEAEENYEDDSASIERYTAYLNVEMGEDYDRLTNKGLKVAWERLKTNEVNAESYVPAVMQYVMSEEGGDKAFLRGLQVEDITMAFNIDIPEGEEFDPSKLDFINIDTEYDDNSEVLSELLAADMILLNAIIYDGKMYFADGYEDVTEDSWGDAEYYYDIVDEDIASA